MVPCGRLSLTIALLLRTTGLPCRRATAPPHTNAAVGSLRQTHLQHCRCRCLTAPLTFGAAAVCWQALRTRTYAFQAWAVVLPVPRALLRTLRRNRLRWRLTCMPRRLARLQRAATGSKTCSSCSVLQMLVQFDEYLLFAFMQRVNGLWVCAVRRQRGGL